MASLTDAAPNHESENATPGKPVFASEMPLQATVEDYTSDDEPQHQRLGRIRVEVDRYKEPQPKSIIGKPSIPKQASVSWVDEPSTSSVSHGRLSEATTAVVPGLDRYDRVSAGKKPFVSVDAAESLVRKPGRRAQSFNRRVPGKELENDDEYTSEEDDWLSQSAPKIHDSRLHPRPHQYLLPSSRADRKVTDPIQHRSNSWDYERIAHEPAIQYPAYPYRYVHDIPHVSYQPWSYPSTDFYGREETDRAHRFSAGSGSTYVEDSMPQGSYHSYRPPSWSNTSYGEVHPHFRPLALPPPSRPPRPSMLLAKPTKEPHQEKNEMLIGAASRENELTGGNKADAGEAKTTRNYNILMENLQQVLKKLETVPAKLDRAPVEDSDTPRASTAVESQTQSSLTDLDLIKLMEERMQILKRKNETKLIEANEVLKYLRRSSESGQQRSDGHTESIRPEHGHDAATSVRNVHKFRIPGDVTDFSDDNNSDDSDSTEGDSIAGNSSGSSISSLRPGASQRNALRNRIGARLSDRTEIESLISTTDESAISVDSRHDSVASKAEPSRNKMESMERRPGNLVESKIVDFVPEDQAVESEMMGEVIALRRDLSILKRQMSRKKKSWSGQTLSSAFARCKRYFRKAPRPGTQRLQWICECGDEMYTDLPVENGAQYQQMLEFLTRPGPKTQQTGQDQTTPSQLEGGTARTDFASLQSSQSSFGQGAIAASTFGSGSTYIGSGSSQLLTTQQDNPYARNRYLELCVNVGKYETKLAEIQVSSSQSNGAAICTDGHLFRQIYHRYFALRKHTWRHFLYRPAGIKFVHFAVQAGYRVSFFSSDPLPSEDAIAAKQYEYSLQPPVPPPMDSRTFLHYFYKHNAHSHSTSAKYVNRLPKKLGESLTRPLGVDDLLEGWGIHIIEGPNKVAICWALMIVLIASLAVSIGYDLIAKSGDSGFAIGQWMVAALTVALSALYFSLEDDVNSDFD